MMSANLWYLSGDNSQNKRSAHWVVLKLVDESLLWHMLLFNREPCIVENSGQAQPTIFRQLPSSCFEKLQKCLLVTDDVDL